MSIDAIGCQQRIAKVIIDSQANYLIGLKANQDGLYEQVVDWFERRKASLPTHTSQDLGHGRAEKRVVMMSEDLDLIDTVPGWIGLKSIICVESSRWLKGNGKKAKRYYVSLLSGHSAAQMGQYIRRHWGRENEQHWHLDVTFDEDGRQVRKDHAPRNLTTVRKLALGLISRDPAKMSLKRKGKKAARDDAYLMMLLSQLNV